MHDVFIVISEGLGGGHMVRTVYAADHDDARQTHQANYADEPLVAVHQLDDPACSHSAATSHRAVRAVGGHAP